jgi:hypothetical protein
MSVNADCKTLIGSVNESSVRFAQGALAQTLLLV